MKTKKQIKNALHAAALDYLRASLEWKRKVVESEQASIAVHAKLGLNRVHSDTGLACHAAIPILEYVIAELAKVPR